MGMSSKQISSDHLDLINWTPPPPQNMMSSLTPSSDQTIIQSPSNPPPHRSSTNIKQRSSLQTTQQQPGDTATTCSLKCPRCDSSNTKFCYYNNYNKTQPRHYCKACKRHWTKGGTLRNVPVGGGRKNKRIKRPTAAANTTAAATIISHDHINLGFSHNDHKKYIFPATQEDNKGGGLLFKPNDQVSTHWDFNGGFATSMQHQQSSHNNQNLGFSIHSSDTNTILPAIIPTSACYSPLLLSSGFKEEDSSTVTTTTTTTRMMSTTPNSSTQPWMQPITPSSSNNNNILEPNNFWTWNDIDYMVQGDHHHHINN